jgi:3,4-dihydroxy 2-butanone 4-phosphate synthase/GTP cyclohydrolase II
VKFAQHHGLKIGTIADIIAYRTRTERLVEEVTRTKLATRFGGAFDLRVYANKMGYAEHLALVCGDLSGDEPVLVRMHQFNLLADALGDTSVGEFSGGEARARSGELEAAMRIIAEKGRGAIIIIREPALDSLSRAVKEREGHGDKRPIHELRQYGIGAQILIDLGITKMVLLTNTKRTIIGLNGYGISLVGQQPFPNGHAATDTK